MKKKIKIIIILILILLLILVGKIIYSSGIEKGHCERFCSYDANLDLIKESHLVCGCIEDCMKVRDRKGFTDYEELDIFENKWGVRLYEHKI